MKVEIELPDNYEHILADIGSIKGTLALAEKLLRASHWHENYNETLADEMAANLDLLNGPLSLLHLLWREQYVQKIMQAAVPVENPLYILRYYSPAEKTFSGKPFATCKNHFHKLHIPSGLTVQRWRETVFVEDLTCKFCDFEEVDSGRIRPNKK